MLVCFCSRIISAYFIFYIQLWARAYRDQTYHAAINTTNGVESQNKLLKYNYLPRKRNATLSQLVTILYVQFVPEAHHKYLYLNCRISDMYRSYNDFVPKYLQGRPRHVIIHCLDRKSGSRKYNEEDILTRDTLNGHFTIQSSKKVHTIDFGIVTGKPSCTCPDWLQWQMPCKHFFGIFRLVEGWGWDALPEIYQEMPYLCADYSALSKQCTNLPAISTEISPSEQSDSEDVATLMQDPLPTKKVRPASNYDMHNLY